MIALENGGEGVVLPIKARPGARRNALLGEYDGALKVAVTAAAEEGKANRAILRLLRQTLSLKGGQLEILSGQTNSRKRVLVRAVDANELRRRLALALAPAPPHSPD